MNSRMRIATYLARGGLALAFACLVAIVLGGLGHRAGWWHFRVGIQMVRWATTVDLAAVVVALAAVIVAWRVGARGALTLGIVALAGSILVALPPLYQYHLVQSLPRIHDITTDTVNPPVFVAVLPLRKGAENATEVSAEVIAQQKEAYPDVVPAVLEVAPAQAFARAERVARAMGWEIVAASPGDLRIEATDTTLLFGFKDDVVIRVAAEGKGSRVDIRSVSRVGRSDVGANARRIRAFLQKIPGG